MASSPDVAALLSSISAAGAGFAQRSPGAREQLLALTYKLTTELETPGEFIQRVGWAEVNFPNILALESSKLVTNLLVASEIRLFTNRSRPQNIRQFGRERFGGCKLH